MTSREKVKHKNKKFTLDKLNRVASQFGFSLTENQSEIKLKENKSNDEITIHLKVLEGLLKKY